MNESINENELKIVVSGLLCLSGIMPNNKGFVYLKEAILIAYNDPDSSGTITKLIYPEIAEVHGGKPGNVERCISAAIEKAWENSKENEFYKKVGFQWLKRKPTNSEYIFMAVEYLRNL